MKKFSTFQTLFEALRPLGTAKSKMFPIPQLWKGISPFVYKLILLCFGRPSLALARSKNLYSLISFLNKLNKHHGSSMSVKWLKACYVCLQRYLGDDTILSLRSIDPNLPLPRLINGLPFIIPKGDRIQIKRSNPKVIQFWLSAFSIYRVTECESNSKLNSITDPYTGSIEYIVNLKEFISKSPFSNFFKPIIGYKKWEEEINLYPSKITFFKTSSPSNNVSWHGMITDLILLRKTSVCYHLDTYLNLVGNKYMNKIFSDIMTLGDRCYSELLKVPNLKAHKGLNPDTWVPCSKKGNYSGLVGQLMFKVEPAGKLRIFAMVDFWTQNVLQPLHRELFKLLKLLPNDGTFDQDASVKRSIEKSSKSCCAYSFDLSSATDRLPLTIQIDILDKLMPIPIGKAWGNLLTDRDYFIPEFSNIIEKGIIRYKVGQPMGALSSWAMLAVTHHFLVQYASFLLGKRGWNEDYEILGDDLVIFNKELADKYLEITKALGVEINLSKSIVSPSRASFEFAKRTVVDSMNVSAISIKQLISETSMSSRLNNILYYSKLGLIRSSFVLSALLSRFGKFKSLTDLNFPLISLLGCLFKQNRLTLSDILKTLIDPRWDEVDLLETVVSLPTQSLLKNFKEMLNKDNAAFSLPKSDDRSDLAEENELLLSDMIVLEALSQSKKLERMFESWKCETKYSLFGSWKSSLNKTDLFAEEWLYEVIDNYTSFDPSDLVDEVERIAIKQAKVHNLSVEEALVLLDKVESKVRQWHISIVANDKVELREGVSPIFNYILINLGGKSNLSYMRARPFFAVL